MPRIKLKHVELMCFMAGCWFLLETGFRLTRYVPKEEDLLDEKIINSTHTSMQGPKKLLILGYQRSGSSFMGSLFNSDPDVFYWFEPMDGLYSAMYGTAGGWNVPTDIFTFENNSRRTIPSIEISALSASLGSILNCEFGTLPTEVLVHPFVGMWLSRHKRLTSFYRCAVWVQQKYHINLNQCRKEVKSLCPTRFGNNYQKQDICRKLFWDVRHHDRSTWKEVLNSRFKNTPQILDKPSQQVIKQFINYHTCMENFTNQLSICLPKLESVCRNSTIRVVKTVRVTMDTVSNMLQNKTDFQILHLVRNPKAVAVSRLKQPSFRGRKSGSDLAKEALAYCQTAARDLSIAKSLAGVHPGKVWPLVYEDFVDKPEVKLKELYKFLDTDQPVSSRKWLNEQTAVENSNSTIRAYLWMKSVTLDVASEINKVCVNLTKAVTYTWP